MILEELEILLDRAQAGHRDAREKIIEQFYPLVIKTASTLSGRYIDKNQDDEISIGMMATNEAIDSFDKGLGASFFSYAKMVIKRRLIDHYRKEQRSNKSIPFSSLSKEENSESEINTLTNVEVKLAVSEFQRSEEQNERREEIITYTKELSEYGIAFSDLVANSPKHEDARIRAIEVAKLVVADRDLKQHLETKKELPLKRLVERVKVSRKTLERQRKYIIAISIIISGEFHHLKEYLQKPLLQDGI